MRDVLPLSSLPGPTVQLTCSKCSLRITRELAELVAEFGPGYPATYLLEELTARCPRRIAGKFSDWCGATYTPESLPAVRLGQGG